MPNSLDRDQTRRFCLKSASLSDLINTVWRRHVILDRGRRFLEMFKTLRPAHFHAFCSHDHSRSIKPNVRKLPPYFCIFILSNCESTKKLLKTCIHLLLSSTAEPGAWKCSNTSLEPTLLIPLFPITNWTLRSTCDFTT